MLQTSLRPAPQLTIGLTQAIALLPLSQTAVLARISLAALENPALRVVIPDGYASPRPLLDPDGFSAPGDSLIGHVLRQIRQINLTPRERVLALSLTEALEPTGWLGTSLDKIARDCGVALSELEAVLLRLQGVEPSGLFARSLEECLRLQLAESGPFSPAAEAVLSRLPLLAKGGSNAVAKESGLDRLVIEQAVRQIRGLNPKPGLIFAAPAPPPAPPDLVARKIGGSWTADLHPGLYRIDVLNAGGDRRAARLWQSAVTRRRELGQRLAALILQRQKDYVEGAGPLKVLTSAELAEAARVHVATVNRVLKGTTLEAPTGTRVLRSWMARPLTARGGLTAGTLRAALTDLLADPDFSAVSDARLTTALAGRGIQIARRTVAKYRAEITGLNSAAS